MAISTEGRPARTDAFVVARFEVAELLRLELHTGRTHQIRVHLEHLGHPVVGDPVYGRDHAGPRLDCPRTLLHASFLSFAHPTQRQRLSFEHPLPEDFEGWLRNARGELAGRRAGP